MKTAIYLLILGCLFYTPAFGWPATTPQTAASPQYTQLRQYTPAQSVPAQNQPQKAAASKASAVEESPRLAGLPNPALVGLQSLRVAALYRNSRLGVDDFLWADTTARAERRLAESDTRLAILIRRGYEFRYFDIPTLTITVDKFILGPTRPPILFVQTALEAGITVERNPTTFLRTIVWSITETVQAEVAQAELAAVSSLIYRQIDRFVSDFSQANSFLTVTPEPNDINSLPKIPAPASATPAPAKPPEKPKDITPKDKPAPPTNFSFVSSTNSIIFHSLSCPYGKSIAPKNFLTYNTREEAIAAGKRPCKKCNP